MHWFHLIPFLCDGQLPAELFNDLGKLLNIIVWLAGAVLLLLKISQHFKKKDPLVPNPVVTERKAEFVTQREFKDLKTEVHETRTKIDALTEKISAVHIDLLEKGEERSKATNERINDILMAIRGNKPATK